MDETRVTGGHTMSDARLRQGHVGVSPVRARLLFPVLLVVCSPTAQAGRCDVQVQAAAVRHFVRLVLRFGSFNLTRGQCHGMDFGNTIVLIPRLSAGLHGTDLDLSAPLCTARPIKKPRPKTVQGSSTLIDTIIGGQRGIRTPDTHKRIHAFQACAFNRSATCPNS